MGAGTVAETGRERRIDSKRSASEPLITSSGLRSAQLCDRAAVPVSSAPKQTEARVIISVRRATIRYARRPKRLSHARWQPR
jgi:hypothetical protein